MKKSGVILIAFFIVLSFIGCKEEKKFISFHDEILVVSVNDIFDLSFDTNIYNHVDIILSYDEGFITVNDNKFEALKAGELTITAYWKVNNLIFDTIIIKINDLPKSIDFLDKNILIKDKEIVTLSLNLVGIFQEEIGYRLSDSEIVTVLYDGKIKAEKNGEVLITAFYLYDDSIFSTILIKVELEDELKQIAFTNNEISIKENETIALPIELTGINSIESIYFEYSENGIIRIEEALIVPIKCGQITLTAIFKDDETIRASIEVIVLQRQIIVFTQNEISLKDNETVNLPIELTGISEIEEIDFEYSEEGIVRIDQNSIVAIKSGEVTLTAILRVDATIRATFVIYVEQRKIISFTQNEIYLKDNETIVLPIELIGINSIEEIDFEYNIEGIISINSNIINPIKSGEVTLTAILRADETIRATLVVFVEASKKIIFTQSEISIALNKTNTLPIVLIGINIEDINFEYGANGIINLEEMLILPIGVGEVILTAILRADETITAWIKIVILEPVYSINEYGYWVQNLSSNYDPNEIIFTAEQINAYNKNITDNSSLTRVVDLLMHNETILGTQVKTLIEFYKNINSYPVYDKGVLLNTNQKDAIVNNRNTSNMPYQISVQYGIVTEFLAVRSYPTLAYSNSSITDRFQETGLNVGEGLVIYHTSNDGEWYFIQAQNYNGWVEKGKIGVCTREEMHNFINPLDFIVTLANLLTIGDSVIRMGQVIPYIDETNDSYIVQIPTRDEDGKLLLKNESVLKSADISKGFLEYTTANVFMQSFKMLGTPYSWGDKYINGRDCSSTQNAVYLCFGFKMPRNTTQQRSIPGYSTNVSSLSESALRTLRPGSLIFSSGHVLMYLGENANGVSYVYHNTSSGVPGCRIQAYSTYTTNIIATLKLY